jgi:nucleoside-diphosphate-sugar epimerase
VLVNVRSDVRAATLRDAGFDVLQLSSLDTAGLAAARIDARTLVVVAYPPDANTDERVAPLLAGAGAIAYLSSTGVYGDVRGIIDDTTPVPPAPTDRSAKRLAAEDCYRKHGAAIFRCAALYGRDRGLHARVIRGDHTIPGDGTRYLSRIHVDDLAQFVLALASHPARGEGFVLGDKEPARHLDVVLFICDAYGVPLPPFVALETVDESLRADRHIDASRAKKWFGINYDYPSYRDGMSPAVTGLTKPPAKSGDSPYRS